MRSLHQGTEGKGITELSDTHTAAADWPRFTCHLEENSISFHDLLRMKAKVVRPGQDLGCISSSVGAISPSQHVLGSLTFVLAQHSSCTVILQFRHRCRLLSDLITADCYPAGWRTRSVLNQMTSSICWSQDLNSPAGPGSGPQPRWHVIQASLKGNICLCCRVPPWFLLKTTPASAWQGLAWKCDGRERPS